MADPTLPGVEAMNEAVRVAAHFGSPAGIDYIARWLHRNQQLTHATVDAVNAAAHGRTFPFDGPQRPRVITTPEHVLYADRPQPEGSAA